MDTYKLLDIKNDAVFKFFFSRPSNRPLLISFLETMLEPQSPIDSVEILNPALDAEMVGDKMSILDLLIRLKNGLKIDVEMQMAGTDGYRQRILYYWSKLHQSQLQTGDTYVKLMPTYSVSVLNYKEFEDNGDDIHSIFELRERQNGSLYSPDLQLHFLELPKYKQWKKKMLSNSNQAILQKYKLLDYWSRFFRASSSTEKELEEIMKEPIMDKAFKALEELSQEPTIREIAEMREKSRIHLLILTSETEARAKAEGKNEGLAEGQKLAADKMLQSGMSDVQVASILGLSLIEVQNILKKIE
jgi:predicted transposase/invertase (TIGR01784 family)